MEYLTFAPASPTSGHRWWQKQFVHWMPSFLLPSWIRQLPFRGFDIDGHGAVSCKEMAHVIENCDGKLLQNVDLSEDGEFDFEEFLMPLCGGQLNPRFQRRTVTCTRAWL